MKTMKTVLLSALMAVLFCVPAISQTFDANRMDRDLKIMESILGEIFKTQIHSANSTAPSVRGNEFTYFSGRSSSRIKGTYVPEYGAIFMIPKQSLNRVILRSQEGKESTVLFQYRTGEENEDLSIDQESVISRISEFLQDYASTIGQLKDEEQVLVIYGAQNAESYGYASFSLNTMTTRSEKNTRETAEPLPVISVSASKKDLNAYRNGSLSSDAFNKKLKISTSDDSEKLDLKVLGNIFKTALGEGEGDQYHLITPSSLSFLFLENFGAMYTLDLHRGHGLTGLRTNVFRVQETIGARDENQEEERVVELEKLKDELADQQKKTEETLKKEYQKLIQRTREFIVDYGRTLKSLSPDQYLLVSLNITDPAGEIPQRVNFQIKKSTLDKMDSGSLSREEAMKAVTMTEY